MSERVYLLVDKNSDASRSESHLDNFIRVWAADNPNSDEYHDSGVESANMLSPENTLPRRHSHLELDTLTVQDEIPEKQRSLSEQLEVPIRPSSLCVATNSNRSRRKLSAVHMFILQKLPNGKAKENFLRQIIDFHTLFSNRITSPKSAPIRLRTPTPVG